MNVDAPRFIAEFLEDPIRIDLNEETFRKEVTQFLPQIAEQLQKNIHSLTEQQITTAFYLCFHEIQEIQYGKK